MFVRAYLNRPTDKPGPLALAHQGTASSISVTGKTIQVEWEILVVRGKFHVHRHLGYMDKEAHSLIVTSEVPADLMKAYTQYVESLYIPF